MSFMTALARAEDELNEAEAAMDAAERRWIDADIRGEAAAWEAYVRASRAFQAAEATFRRVTS